GPITRNAGGTVNFTLPSNGAISTSQTNTNGILGGYATVGGNTWATVPNGTILGLSGTFYSNSFTSPNVNLDVPNGGGSLSVNPNSIRFNDPHANPVTIATEQAITSGGILVTSTVGSNLSSIDGGTLKGASGVDLVIIQNNSNARLKIGSAIADNGAATGLTKAGPGVLTLTGNNTYTGATAITAGTLTVDGTISTSASVLVGSGATVAGSGAVSTLTGSGMVAPGTNGAGILRAQSLDGSAGTDFAFEFTQLSPTYSSATASGNDLLRLSGAAPFVMRLGGANLVAINFLGGTGPALGQTFTGGFFTDLPTDFSSMVIGANFIGTFNGGALPNGYTIRFDGMVNATANFASGSPVSGRVAQVTVVPEPETWAMLFGGACLTFGLRRLRR
ncbi:MAG: fibronectin-binding autotransporter adhesin, partial [Chthoniobacter sp.]|nr:fibronectin-binding autotransporter adhesin [Chthoniobacter sp.]